MARNAHTARPSLTSPQLVALRAIVRSGGDYAPTRRNWQVCERLEAMGLVAWGRTGYTATTDGVRAARP